ncbi:MAG: zinc-binding dehydrogenase [Alphaproteobacteria bacterium]|nr:zinc-binding dehydrogenase [Alphaproteobacteria bacterium]
MLALRLEKEGQPSRLMEVPHPGAPAGDEVLVRMRAVSLNHIDLFGQRGMAFAQRQAFPLTAGVEAAGEVEAVGPDVRTVRPGQAVVVHPALFCGDCRWCNRGRENLCENVGGIAGFHVDGFACHYVKAAERRVVPVPEGVSLRDAACTTVTFGTVQHMLFDNAKLEPGETILVQAGGSGIGTTAIKMAKAIGATVITTVGSDDKVEKAKAIGADHVINYREERFETRVRRLTGKKGVQVVFEHVGADTWAGSLLALERGGRLVTCGSTSGINANTNLYQVFQQQLTIIGSFGSSLRNLREALDKMATGLTPVIDSEIDLTEFGLALERLQSRQVFGKIVATIS